MQMVVSPLRSPETQLVCRKSLACGYTIVSCIVTGEIERLLYCHLSLVYSSVVVAAPKELAMGTCDMIKGTIQRAPHMRVISVRSA